MTDFIDKALWGGVVGLIGNFLINAVANFVFSQLHQQVLTEVHP